MKFTNYKKLMDILPDEEFSYSSERSNETQDEQNIKICKVNPSKFISQ